MHEYLTASHVRNLRQDSLSSEEELVSGEACYQPTNRALPEYLVSKPLEVSYPAPLND